MTLINEVLNVNIESDYEAFEIIKNHLLTQKDKSMHDGAGCSYRGCDSVNVLDEDTGELVNGYEIVYNGKSCAVGILIKDDFYHDSLEDNSAEESNVIDALQRSHPEWDITLETKTMLLCCQAIHDQMYEYDWASALKILSLHLFSEDHELDIKNGLFFNDGTFDLLGTREQIMKAIKSTFYRRDLSREQEF